MKKEKIILFDLDGTLIDATEAILESFAVAFEQCGGELPNATRIKAEIGHPLEDMFASLGVENIYIEKYVISLQRALSKDKLPENSAASGCGESSGISTQRGISGCVTTKTCIYSVELLEYMGLMKYFDVLIGREHVIHPKPNPEPIQKALLQLPEVTSGVWMIGDTCMDMYAAEAANIDGIAVLCGYGSEELLMKCSIKSIKIP